MNNPQTQTTPNKRPRLDWNSAQTSLLMSRLHQKLIQLKIIKCEECQHFASHPNANFWIGNLTCEIYKLQNPPLLDHANSTVFPCLSNRCTHNCTHMPQVIANLQIIKCAELRHIVSRKALQVEEVEDVEKNVLACILNNCTNDCQHMVPLQSITRCQQECKTYHQISKLGEGGFGSVWKMRTPPKETFFNTHRFVAMKRVVDPDASSYNEVEILKKLNHPNIVKYLTSYTNESNDLCIIMEYCKIGDLKDLIESRWPQIATEKNIIAIIANIVDALNYIHQQGIIHRDIKPNNILCGVHSLVQSSIKIKLADFGLAKLMDLRTQSGRQVALTNCGTSIYMSPEAIRGQPYGTATDIFSFGATISFLCNQGRHLFTSREAVLQWTGGKSTIDENIYSIYLQKLMTIMLCPQAEKRPKANDILEKVKTLGTILRY